MKFETGQTSEPISTNISIVSRSSKRGPTMLRSFAQHFQQCCARACAPKSGMYGTVGICVPDSLYSHLKTQHVLTCCERLHTSANIVQQETTLLAPSMFRVVASVFTGLNKTAFASFRGR